jgi:hypothetical protein
MSTLICTTPANRRSAVQTTSDVDTGDAAAAVERHPCPQCDVPAGSACRTRAGKTAAKYHTARFILVPALRDDLTAPVPTNRASP